MKLFLKTTIILLCYQKAGLWRVHGGPEDRVVHLVGGDCERLGSFFEQEACCRLVLLCALPLLAGPVREECDELITRFHGVKAGPACVGIFPSDSSRSPDLSTGSFGDYPGSGGIVHFLRFRCGFFPKENGEFSPPDGVKASTYVWRYSFYSIFITYP